MSIILKKEPIRYVVPILYFIGIILMVIIQWTWQINIRNESGSPLYRNLKKGDAFIKRGFDASHFADISEITESPEWFKFNSPPFTIVNSTLPDLPERTFLSPFGKPDEEFTIVIPIEIDSDTFDYLINVPSAMPGMFFGFIGENWEIYFNERIIRSEVHLDEYGQIKNYRSWRGVSFPISRSYFHLGTNILTLRIIGDPSYGVTGLYYAEPYYMDDFKIIQMKHQSYIRYFFCGVLGYTGIYFLLIFIFIRKNKREIYNLYYSIFSFMLCIHFFVSEGTINSIIPNSNIAARLEYLSIFIALSMLCVFIEQMGRNKVTKVSWCFTAFAVYISITQLFFTNQYADEVLHIFLVSLLVYFTYIFIGIIKDRLNNKLNHDERRSSSFSNILVGSLIVYACGIHDALDIVIFRNSFRLFLYSTFVFHLGMTLTMAGRFSIVYKKLEQSNALLEKTVHERTLELEKQTKIAVQASQAKSEFLATMSHEIRTPLNAVIGLSEIELQGDLSQKSKSNINQIYQSGSSLLEIINEILDISKIEAGSFNFIPVEYETAALINDSINLNRVRIASKPIDFILNISGDFPRKLFGDERRVKQILNNILSNAFKYTKKGSVTLSAAYEKIDDTALLKFSVSDTGIGIRHEDVNRLFDDYLQLDTKANRRIEGTGLGLAITKKLLEMMGGSISIDSEYGKGSTFKVKLPQMIINDEVIGEETAKKLKNFQYISAGKERELNRAWMPYGKVLVVDDMQVNHLVAKGFLRPYGIQVDTALSGQAAIDMISQKDYNLVFMDHMMPGMDGIETVEIIRGKNIKVPIIALTANAVVGNREMFLSKGFDGFISKPIDVILLDETLNRWIRDKQNAEVLKNAEEENKHNNKKEEPAADEEMKHNLDFPGVDVDFGISATGGTAEGYLRVLAAICRDTQERLQFLNEYFNNEISEQNTKSFTIHVHALKSAFASIGAKEISKKAAALEAAGKANDQNFIKENLMELTDGLSELIKIINESINADGG